MTLQVVAVSRSRSLYVKTLHTLLGLQNLCWHVKLKIGLNFVDDKNIEKMALLKNLLKTGDRVVWFEYGVSMDVKQLQTLITEFTQYDGLVVPVAVEGIDWEMFRKKTLEGSVEPSYQRGLTFDTKVQSKPFNEEQDLYPVVSTDPSIWALDTHACIKKLKDKKSNGLVLPPNLTKFFDQLLAKKMRLMAAAGVQTFSHFTHECVGNLMNIPGLRVTKDV